MSNLIIFPIKAFQDNYIWAITQPETAEVWLVDPGEAFPVFHYLQKNKYSLGGILITHHHFDHRGGVLELLEKYPVPVIGPMHEDIPATSIINKGDVIQLLGLNLSVLSIPGHTLEHVAYYSQAQGILFCGDTLFSAGCGRVFEGTYEQMYQSLMELKALPESTKIYCGHEYTQDNLQFAKCLEPRNNDLLERINEVNQLRQKDYPTVPSTLALEKKINPFLRCDYQTIIDAASKHSNTKLTEPDKVFKIIRVWKNNFSIKWPN